MNPESNAVREPGPQLLHEVFEAAARRLPDQVAIEVPPAGSSPRRRLTYAEVDRLANALAARLAPFVSGESVVAILLPRRDHLVYVAQLAVMKAGAAYTCVEPGIRPERLRFVLKDSGAVAAITSEELRGRLAGLGFPAEHTLMADEAQPAAAPALPIPRRPWLSPSTLCYLIYTSGTTGNPNGVMVEHH